MRMSDWSSDVCSSDLQGLAVGQGELFGEGLGHAGEPEGGEAFVGVMDEHAVISWWSVEVVLAADVGVPDGIGVGGGVRQERLVEAVLQDRGDRSVAGGADRQAAPAGGLDAHRAVDRKSTRLNSSH